MADTRLEPDIKSGIPNVLFGPSPDSPDSGIEDRLAAVYRW